jgi:hypothetical protein
MRTQQVFKATPHASHQGRGPAGGTQAPRLRCPFPYIIDMRTQQVWRATRGASHQGHAPAGLTQAPRAGHFLIQQTFAHNKSGKPHVMPASKVRGPAGKHQAPRAVDSFPYTIHGVTTASACSTSCHAWRSSAKMLIAQTWAPSAGPAPTLLRSRNPYQHTRSHKKLCKQYTCQPPESWASIRWLRGPGTKVCRNQPEHYLVPVSTVTH